MGYTKIDHVDQLVDEGILGSELMPTPNYRHWPAVIPDLLPDTFEDDMARYGEIRWYGE